MVVRRELFRAISDLLSGLLRHAGKAYSGTPQTNTIAAISRVVALALQEVQAKHLRKLY